MTRKARKTETPKVDLVEQYRPLGIAAIAAAALMVSPAHLAELAG